jgi:uncharacterized protein (DUF2141 family)
MFFRAFWEYLTKGDLGKLAIKKYSDCHEIFLPYTQMFLVSSNTTKLADSSLIVTVSGLRNPQGQLCLSLFSNEQGFPNKGDCAVQTSCIKLTSVPLVVKFQNLEVGSYAIAVFHDANNDGTLNRNWLGIPTEGFGFSQNPSIFKGLPKFKDSAVLVAGADTNIEIELQYLRFINDPNSAPIA